MSGKRYTSKIINFGSKSKTLKKRKSISKSATTSISIRKNDNGKKMLLTNKEIVDICKVDVNNFELPGNSHELIVFVIIIVELCKILH
jgi:hypothetical protein